MINVFLKRLSYENRMELISSERVTCGCLADRLSSGGHDSDEPAVGKDMRLTMRIHTMCLAVGHLLPVWKLK